jgi:hypothetical protein
VKHGCHNLPREAKPLLVQDGWTRPIVVQDGNSTYLTRMPLIREIPFVNSVDCRHDKRLTDSGCEGCIHAKEAEA